MHGEAVSLLLSFLITHPNTHSGSVSSLIHKTIHTLRHLHKVFIGVNCVLFPVVMAEVDDRNGIEASLSHDKLHVE